MFGLLVEDIEGGYDSRAPLASPGVEPHIGIVVGVVALQAHVEASQQQAERLVHPRPPGVVAETASGVARSNHKDMARTRSLGNSARDAVLAVVRAVGGAHADADDTRHAHTVGIGVDVLDAVHHLYLREAYVQRRRHTQHDVGSRSHAAITIDVGTGCDACHVGAVGTLAVGSERIDLLIHEDGARQRVVAKGCGMSGIVGDVIHPDDARLGGVAAGLEGRVLIVKSIVDDADYHPRAVIGLGQSVIGAVEHLSRTGRDQGAVGAQGHLLAHLEPSDAVQPRHLEQTVDRHLGRDKSLEFAIDQHTQPFEGGQHAATVDVDKRIDHFHAVDDTRSDIDRVDHRQHAVAVLSRHALDVAAFVKETLQRQCRLILQLGECHHQG